jgi:hypothetical protein
MLLIAGGIGLTYARSRAKATTPTEDPLSAEEQARLDEILGR